ncbi:methylmalonyl Co-A mutase-associated GTPase MeaB [Blastochloris tepida]|uniref:ATPase/protein kinase n=1 Tax=Blastochloris tepida TaxID=2233851 RepID=A0A348G3Q5_9HYPH|nr:methylmalonyl Co-A mutase-associated GTPase MeaB [Blastochloris tepida]BBF94188.1 ATPase/protein kinase [Blastochloris tepida]
MTNLARSSESAGIGALVSGVRARNRAAVARAITLVESKKPAHQAEARALLKELLPFTGRAIRVGITGVPGVGKSTTIDVLGSHLTAKGHRVAVLAVDPSSTRTGGSILGDKTRMVNLSADDNAFIRPSPSAGTLGGVAAKTRETMLVCEAADYDVILIETVGIGQSETAVADLTDTFVALMLPGAGDELQGIKKGLLELADLIAVNKADGDNVVRARAAAAEYKAALHILTPASTVWQPPVITYSAATGDGIALLWSHILDHRAKAEAAGDLQAKRRAQQVKWMWAMVDDRLKAKIQSDPAVRARVPALEKAVAEGTMPVSLAAEEIAALLGF